jgi:phytoene desaturase
VGAVASKKVIVIGSGYGGLSAACYLARDGYDVTVVEKNSSVGGRGMVSKVSGFTFDMGPSWYMMPDVFDEFFADFGKKTSDYFELVKLDPSYKIFTPGDAYDVFDAPRVYELFERLEPGSSLQLKKLLSKTKKEYDSVRRDLLARPMDKYSDLLSATTLKMLADPAVFGSYHSRIKKYIHHPDLQKILEFMVVFMGGSPTNIPALYTLLTHVDMGLGIWYPIGGMGQLAGAVHKLAKTLGVKFLFDSPVEKILYESRKANGVVIAGKKLECDIVVANADMHHVENSLLGKDTQSTWQKKTLSPSGLLIYLGVNKKLEGLRHHNMFFDVDWDEHFEQVFEQKTWSEKPMFYVGCPSVTDSTVAPKNSENLFILAPMANGDQPSAEVLQRTADSLIARIEDKIGQKFVGNIVYKDVQAHDYFKDTFNAYKGNAFGLAHTISQSAVFRPKMRNTDIKNLFYVGQYTNPGTGVPIVAIGGKVVASYIAKVERGAV